MKLFKRQRYINEQDVYDEIRFESNIAAEMHIDNLFNTRDDAAIEEINPLVNGSLILNIKNRNKKILYALHSKI